MSSSNGTPAVAAAWFQDPHDATQWRWWDGTAWTEHVQPVVPIEQQGRATPTAAAPDVDRWELPPPTAPTFPQDAYPKSVVASFAKATRSAYRRQAPYLAWHAILAVVAGVIGVVVAQFTRENWLVWDDHEEERRATAEATNVWTHAVWRVQDAARSEAWRRILAQRGLELHQGRPASWGAGGAMLPVLRDGASDLRWMGGGLLGGMRGCCGEMVTVRFDDDGRERRSLRMFVAFDVPPLSAHRHAGVTVRQRRVGGRLRGGGAPWKDGVRVELESIAVARSLTIDVSPRTDPVATRELFGPQLVAALDETPVSWDQRGQLLVAFVDSPSEPGRSFDAFVAAGVAVARAYWTDQD